LFNFNIGFCKVLPKDTGGYQLNPAAKKDNAGQRRPSRNGIAEEKFADY
jgi:hypothetical protein